VVVEYHDTVSGDVKTANIDYDSLSAAEKTKVDDCVSMLQGKLPA